MGSHRSAQTVAPSAIAPRPRRRRGWPGLLVVAAVGALVASATLGLVLLKQVGDEAALRNWYLSGGSQEIDTLQGDVIAVQLADARGATGDVAGRCTDLRRDLAAAREKPPPGAARGPWDDAVRFVDLGIGECSAAKLADPDDAAFAIATSYLDQAEVAARAALASG